MLALSGPKFHPLFVTERVPQAWPADCGSERGSCQHPNSVDLDAIDS